MISIKKKIFLHKKSDGFSLMEIMIAVAIIGVVLGIAGPAIYSFLARSKVTGTKASLQAIKSALQLYREDVGKYPTSREGLEVLFETSNPKTGARGPYLQGTPEKALRDGWKQEFEYNQPPVKYKSLYKFFEIISSGGGESDEAELHDGI